jgi:hypothetical protein
MMAIEDTCTTPRYSGEFKDLNWEKLKPPGIRYQPRETPLVGMFDTSRPKDTTRPYAPKRTDR